MISPSASDFVRYLRRSGWVLVRQRGSHARFYHSEKNVRITVPVHGFSPIPIGTFKQILRDAHITADELAEHL